MSIFEKIKNYFSAPAPNIRQEVQERDFDEHHNSIITKEKRKTIKNKAYKSASKDDHVLSQHEMVLVGLGVWAWIEKRGKLYYGDIPNISGIMYSYMNNSHEECERNLQRNIDNSIPSSFSSFRQGITFNEIQDEHPNAKIIFIPIHRK